MHETKFGAFTTEQTRCIVAPAMADVFVGDLATHAKWFVPILSFELSDINPAWSGRAHFVYHEVGDGQSIGYRLTGGKYDYEGDYRECNQFEPIVEPPTFKVPGFIDLIAVRVPAPSDSYVIPEDAEETARRVWADAPEWQEVRKSYLYWEAVEAVAQAVNAKLTCNLKFGGLPKWTQREDVPLDEKGRPMTFVGQLGAQLFSDNMAYVDYFLFYSADERRVTIVNQVT